MKKLVCVLSCFAIFFSALFVPSARVYAASSKAEILVEAGTGQVLFSQNADKKLPIASITKVMTLLICAEEIEAGTLSLEDKIKASSYASGAEGSVIWLNAGEEMTAAELLEAVIVSSANDACIALAEHISGSEAAFVKRMNERAKELKMNDTRYANCVGYDDDVHYSTARDVAAVTAELMKHDVFRGWMLTWLDYLRGGETQLVNTNKLVRTYDGILGGKTGTTDNAGCCLTVCAERGDMRLIAVTLGCENDDERFSSAKELLDYGFGGFERFTPEIDYSELKPIKVTHGTEREISPVIKTQDKDCVIKKGRSADVKYEYTFVEQCKAPVETGQFLGEYLVTLDGAEVFRSDIIATREIPKMNFWRCLWLIVSEMASF
ncbi:MAG: D-alanyl-D-alanine carboxypeptidase [Lachnospiraceae bacterium]|nr:D-alanyl-D-alanine carboxypeptidase [Ruminococcus sp.]MCM1275205.1 D-alanyl-D-alanine carboxypeptidase [Lachnospiraceae bacterium]